MTFYNKDILGFDGIFEAVTKLYMFRCKVLEKTVRRFTLEASHPAVGTYEVVLERNHFKEFNLLVGDVVEGEAELIFFKNSRKRPRINFLPFGKNRLIKQQ